jgi:hypothetical protein
VSDYPLAFFDPPVPLPKLDSWHWRRRFRCPNPACARDRQQAGRRGRRVIGWQQIHKWVHVRGVPTRPDGTVEAEAPILPDEVGYLIEKVWLANELTDLPDLPDGTRSFGLPEGARGNPGRSSRAHAISVLASAGPTLFQGSGDPYRAPRHAAGRVGGGTGYWLIALTYPKTLRPFVVTCPDCESRCRVDSTLPEDELRQLDASSA